MVFQLVLILICDQIWKIIYGLKLDTEIGKYVVNRN